MPAGMLWAQVGNGEEIMRMKAILTGLCVAGMLCTMPFCGVEAAQAPMAERGAKEVLGAALEETEGEAVPEPAGIPAQSMHKVRLTWPVTPRAVYYQLVVLKDSGDYPENIALVKDKVYTNGVEVDLTPFGEEKKDFCWKVCPLDFEGRPVEPFSKPCPIAETGEFNTTAPLPTTEFEKMADAPLYPVYSWIPVLESQHHEVQVYRCGPGGDRLVHTLQAGRYTIYEDSGYTQPGDYYWRVRAVEEDGTPVSDWSEKSPFRVKDHVVVAALGDSITHGGGAFSVSPGYTLYDWETYSEVPVKNLGLSGDTTEQMLDRFERDVLPFRPKILVIMGGVNDFREWTFAWTTMHNLQQICDKCRTNGIIPVLATATPINPRVIALRGMSEVPLADWVDRQQYVNDWVMKQKYAVDVSSKLTDENGNLKAGFTTDGIHPDDVAKKHIGETIGAYLMKEFPEIVTK